MTVNTPFPDETATVTIEDIRDRNGAVIDENAITYDSTVTVKGRAAPDTELVLRDRVTPLTEVTSGPGGIWTKTFTLPLFKCVVLSAIEKKAPFDYSGPRRLTAATLTPIINTVTGDGKPIENGGGYDGDAAEFTGNAPPSAMLKVFDGETELSEKATVNACGLFKFTLSGLEEKKYEIKFQAPDGKESSVFTFTKGEGVPLSIDDVLTDDDTSVPEGESTIEKNLTLIGTAGALAKVKLVGGVPTPVDVKADDKGNWTHRFVNLANGPYSVTAEAIGNRLAPTTPRTFTVRAATAVTLVDITDAANNVIAEDSTTSEKSLFVNCTGEKDKEIQAFDGETLLGQEVVKADGTCKIEIGPLSNKPYVVKAVARYPEGGESRTYSFTVETAKPSEITLLVGENNEQIENGGATKSKWLVVRGKAAAGKRMKLNGAPVPPSDDTANENGICVHFVSKLPPAKYTFTIQESDGSTPASDDYVVTVLP